MSCPRWSSWHAQSWLLLQMLQVYPNENSLLYRCRSLSFRSSSGTIQSVHQRVVLLLRTNMDHPKVGTTVFSINDAAMSR